MNATALTPADVTAYLKDRGGRIRHTESYFPSFEAVEVIDAAKLNPSDEYTVAPVKGGIELRLTPKVGMGATELGWTDRHPFEVVRVVSDRTIEVRAMRAEGGLKKDAAFIPGGFVGHFPNQREDQTWTLTSDPAAPVVRLRLNVNGEWVNGSRKFFIGRADKFHDYNF